MKSYQTLGYLKKAQRNINFNRVRYESGMFSGAFLARQRQTFNYLKSLPSSSSENLENEPTLTNNEIEVINHKIYDQLHTIEPDELDKISQLDLLEQLFGIFKVFHKHCRSTELVLDKNFWIVSDETAIKDPNSFPIEKTSSVLPKWTSIFDQDSDLRKTVAADQGFFVRAENSKLEHHDAHEGVFQYVNPDAEKCQNLHFDTDAQKVQPGTLICMMPGVMQQHVFSEKQSADHAARQNDVVCNFNEKIYYPNTNGDDYASLQENKDQSDLLKSDRKLIKVPGNYINFYGIADKINHASESHNANCQLVDLRIPSDFFPQDYYRYLPVLQYSKDKDGYIYLVCVVATEEINSGDELYLDYIKELQYDEDNEALPDWLIHKNIGVSTTEQSKWLSRREYSNQWAIDLFGVGDKHQNSKYDRTKILENIEKVDKVLNEKVLNLQIEGKDNENIKLSDKVKILMGRTTYNDSDKTDSKSIETVKNN